MKKRVFAHLLYQEKSFIKKVVVCFCMISAFCFADINKLHAEGLVNLIIPSQEQIVSEIPFKLALVPDIIESTVALSTFASSFIYKGFFNVSDWDGVKPDINNVPAFDRWLARPYNHSLDLASDVVTMVNLALMPLAFFGTELVIGNVEFTDVLVLTKLYGDAFFLSYGIKNWMNIGFNRYRPYMYFDNPNEDEISNGEFEWSFPSGHTKAAFMTATFLNYVLCQCYPESVWKWPVIGGAYTVAFVSGALRVMAGSHFLSDVIAGAAIGSFFGFIIPYMHYVKPYESLIKTNEDVTAAVTPLGVSITVPLTLTRY